MGRIYKMKAKLNAIKNKMRQMAPSTHVSGYSQSRKIEGFINRTRPKRMYRSVFFTIQKGLADEVELIRKIVQMVYKVQGYESYDKFPLFCISFGFEGRLDQASRPFKLYQYHSSIVKKLIELSGFDKPEPCVLDKICFKIADPLLGGKTRAVIPRKIDDLLVIFCHDKSNVQISNNVAKS